MIGEKATVLVTAIAIMIGYDWFKVAPSHCPPLDVNLPYIFV